MFKVKSKYCIVLIVLFDQLYGQVPLAKKRLYEYVHFRLPNVLYWICLCLSETRLPLNLMVDHNFLQI